MLQAFERLLDNPNLKQYSSTAPSRWLLLLEHTATMLMTGILILLMSLMTHAVTAVPFCIWLFLQWRAWRQGHPSFVGRFCGVFLVHGRHCHLASTWRIAVSSLLDRALELTTLGLGFMFGTLPAVLLLHDRQTLGQRLMHIAPLRENEEPIHIGQFWSPSQRRHQGYDSRATARSADLQQERFLH